MRERKKPQAIIFEGDSKRLEILREDLRACRIDLATRPFVVIKEVENELELLSLRFGPYQPELSRMRFSLAIVGGNMGEPGILNSIADRKKVVDLVRSINPRARILKVGGAGLAEEQIEGTYSSKSYFQYPPETRVRIINETRARKKRPVPTL